MGYLFTKKNLLAALFLIIGGFLLNETYTERVVFYMAEDELGPMTYPRYLLWGWLVLSGLYLIIPREPFNPEDIKAYLPTLLLMVVTIVSYILLFKYVGLLLSTLLFLLLFFYILNYRDPKKMVTIAVSTAVIVWLVFEKMLAVPMPTSIMQTLFN